MRTPVTFAAALLLLGCTQAQESKQVVRSVQTQIATTSSLPDSNIYSGEVRARYETDLGFRVSGKMTARMVDVGAIVRKGQLLARLDATDNQSGTDAVQASVSAARAEHRLAAAELERYRSLADKNFVSQTALDQRQATLDAARARLDQAEAQLALSRNQLGYTSLMADQDGVITAVMGEAGQVISAGQPVIRLARLFEKEVLISIPETRLAATRAARDLLVRMWADPARTYKGKLRELSPVADASTRTFSARISIADAGPEVALGMTANVLFPGTRAEANEPIVLPLTAIFRANDKAAVWVVDPKTNQVALKHVTVAKYRENGAEILTGISAGEVVVTAGANKLVAGQVVRVQPTQHKPQSIAPAQVPVTAQPGTAVQK